jgi:hypothetical protein
MECMAKEATFEKRRTPNGGRACRRFETLSLLTMLLAESH